MIKTIMDCTECTHYLLIMQPFHVYLLNGHARTIYNGNDHPMKNALVELPQTYQPYSYLPSMNVSTVWMQIFHF